MLVFEERPARCVALLAQDVQPIVLCFSWAALNADRCSIHLIELRTQLFERWALCFRVGVGRVCLRNLLVQLWPECDRKRRITPLSPNPLLPHTLVVRQLAQLGLKVDKGPCAFKARTNPPEVFLFAVGEVPRGANVLEPWHALDRRALNVHAVLRQA